MTESNSYVGLTSVLVQSTIIEWLTTLGLVFGGCCSNACALEILTSQNPNAGSLVTFAQFLFVSLYGLRKQLILLPENDTQSDVLDRKRLLDNLAKDVVEFHSRSNQKPGILVPVIIDGPSSAASQSFGAELQMKIKKISPLELSVKCVRNTIHDTTAGLTSEFRNTNDNLEHVSSVIELDGGVKAVSLLSPPATYSIFLNTQNWRKIGYYTLQRLAAADVSSSSDSVVIITPAPSPPCKQGRWSLTPRAIMRLRFKTPKVPVSCWAVQVLLFFISSLLNNAAFGYNVPMSVHIIFRSGGLVVNMLMGWLIGGRRYNLVQVLSVSLVTAGVACTTLSGSTPFQAKAVSSTSSYLIGIVILTLALVISGFMGLSQDKVYAQYGRGEWEESMFYLHFLALPGFCLVWHDIMRQFRAVNSSMRARTVDIGVETIVIRIQKIMQVENNDLIASNLPILRHIWKRRYPSFYIALAVNVMTHLLCVSGVNRLTTRVNSLTVTLVLVVRKAISLVISVVVLRRAQGEGLLLWTGAGLVLIGTVGYTYGTRGRTEGRQARKEE